MKKITLLILLFVQIAIYGQDIPLLEKAHEISRQAKKGYLAQVVANPAKQTFDLIFIFKSGFKEKIKAQTYTFDKDLNQIAQNEEEIEIEKARQRWKWFKFKGEVYKINMATASVDMKWNMTFRKKEITQRWNWWLGQYDNEVNILDKIKPKDEFGNNYLFKGGHYDNEETGKLLLLGANKEGKSKWGSTNYDVLEVDDLVSTKKIDQLNFEGPYQPIFSKPIYMVDDNNESLPDWALVFAPSDDKNQKHKPTDMVYVRISPTGKVLEKVPFEAQTNGFRVLYAVQTNGVVRLLGTGVEKDKEDKYFEKLMGQSVAVSTLTKAEQAISADNTGVGSRAASLLVGGAAAKMLSKYSSMDSALPVQEDLDEIFNQKDYDHFFVGEIKNGAYKALSYPSVKDFEKVHQKPADQRKYFDWDGKSFQIDNVFFGKDGSIDVTGQDKNKGAFKEAYNFRFDANGKLVASYGVEVDQKNKGGFFASDGPKSDDYPVDNRLQASVDNSKTYWFMNKVKTVREKTDVDYDYGQVALAVVKTTTKSWTPLKSIQYGSIDNKTLEMSATKDLGEDEKRKYYLFPGSNSVQLNQYRIYLSETVRGDKILLSRFDTSK